MTTITSKWSDHADRWITWDTTDGKLVKIQRPTDFARAYGLTQKQELYLRFGTAPLSEEEIVEQYETPTYALNTATGKIEASYQEVLDTNIETNPALFVPGERQSADHYYGRPLPEGVTYPRPS